MTDNKSLALVGERQGFRLSVALQLAELGVTNEVGQAFYLDEEDGLEAELSSESLGDFVGEVVTVYGFQVTKNPHLIIKGEPRDGYVTVLKIADSDGAIHFVSTVSETVLSKLIRLHLGARFSSHGITVLVTEAKSNSGNTFYDLGSAKAPPKKKFKK